LISTADIPALSWEFHGSAHAGEEFLPSRAPASAVVDENISPSTLVGGKGGGRMRKSLSLLGAFAVALHGDFRQHRQLRMDLGALALREAE
jgi:hypothetical protein